MDHIVSAPWFALGMFAGMLLFFAVGRRIGAKTQSGETNHPFGVIDGAILGLFSLLISFTFSGAAARFDAHRRLIGEEANAIGTAYLRVDLLPGAAQPALRDSFRGYLDSRLEVYRKLPDVSAAGAELAKSARLQSEIWRRAVAATEVPGVHPDAAKLLLPALNQMIDITTTRMMVAQLHPPIAILLLLFGLGLASSVLAGISVARSARRGLIHVIGYAAITAITVFVIVDLEYPRFGMIRADAYDKVLNDLRQSMNEPR